MSSISSEIQALITLLDDPDGSIHNCVIERLEEIGEEVIKPLEKSWESTLSPPAQSRIEDIIRNIQHNTIRIDMQQWIDTGGENLLFGAYLLAKIQYPELEYEHLNMQIEALRSQIWLELNDHLTALEKVKVINYFLFTIHKFSRSSRGMTMPQLFFINHVLDTHKGSPVILGIIYAEIASRLDLSIKGVNLPMNFVLCYHDPGYLDDPDGVMFYIHPYSNGDILGRNELEYFLTEQKIDMKPAYLKPCTHIDILIRLAENLIYAYTSSKKEEKTAILKEMRDMLWERRSNQTW